MCTEDAGRAWLEASLLPYDDTGRKGACSGLGRIPGLHPLSDPSPSSPNRFDPDLSSPEETHRYPIPTASPVKNRSQSKSRMLQSVEQEPITVATPSRSTRRATAPPCGRITTLQETVPDLIDQATALSGGRTATLQHFFPNTYKKKSKSKKTTTAQQMEFSSASESNEAQDTSDEAQQQDDTICITG